jgi:uncharacterized membrane protein
LAGQRLIQAAAERYAIAPGHLGVPLLVVGDRALIGSFEIPDQLPGIIERGLAAGGIGWPDIAGLREALLAAGVQDSTLGRTVEEELADAGEASVAREAGPKPVAPDTAAARVPVRVTAAPESGPGVEEADEGDAPGAPRSTESPPAAPSGSPRQTGGDGAIPLEVPAPPSPTDEVTAPEIARAETTLAVPGSGTPGYIMDLAGAESHTSGLTPWQKFEQDRTGNAIAVLVLLGMIASVIGLFVTIVKGATVPRVPGWLVALMIVAGLIVASYLSYVEITQSLAVCGPVGDCNTVQQSPYARLFGIIPIGVLGVYGYLALGLGWMVRDSGPHRWNGVVAAGLWLGALLGTLFSIYLTFLEPFVIGATCLWCVTSAVLMTLLLWAATPAAVEAWRESSATD